MKRRRGILISTGQGPRSKEGGRFPESARLKAQATIRSAMARRANRPDLPEPKASE